MKGEKYDYIIVIINNSDNGVTTIDHCYYDNWGNSIANSIIAGFDDSLSYYQGYLL